MERVEVAFFDGRRVPGQPSGATDPSTDLAVVQVDRKDLKPATFQRALPQVGELAVAFGSPLGFEHRHRRHHLRPAPRDPRLGLAGHPVAGRPDSRPDMTHLLATPAAPCSTAAARWSASVWPTSLPSRARYRSASQSPPPPPSTWSATCCTGRATHAYLGIEPAPVTARLPPSSAWTRPPRGPGHGGGGRHPGRRAGLQPGDVISASTTSRSTPSRISSASSASTAGDRVKPHYSSETGPRTTDHGNPSRQPPTGKSVSRSWDLGRLVPPAGTRRRPPARPGRSQPETEGAPPTAIGDGAGRPGDESGK